MGLLVCEAYLVVSFLVSGPCFVIKLFLAEEERAVCFTIIVFLV